MLGMSAYCYNMQLTRTIIANESAERRRELTRRQRYRAEARDSCVCRKNFERSRENVM